MAYEKLIHIPADTTVGVALSLETAKKLGLSASIIWLITPVILGIAYVSFFFAMLGNISSVSSGAFSGSLSNMLLSVTGLYGVIIAVGIVSIIALVFFLIAMYNLSKYYSEPSIFRNLIYALIVGVAGSLITVGIFVAVTFAAVGSYVASGASAVTAYPVFGLFALVILVVAVLAISIVTVVLVRRAFCKLADKSGVEQFRTAGLLILIGAFVPFVGSIISYIAWIFTALGFHRLAPVQETPGGYAVTPYVSSSSGPVKRCLHCGAENNPESHYCRICGSQLS